MFSTSSVTIYVRVAWGTAHCLSVTQFPHLGKCTSRAIVRSKESSTVSLWEYMQGVLTELPVLGFRGREGVLGW